MNVADPRASAGPFQGRNTTRLELPAPLDLAGSLEPFRRWGDDLLDRFDGHRLVRTVPSRRGIVPFAATLDGSPQTPAMVVEVAASDQLSTAASAVQGMFVQASSLVALTRRDPVIRTLEARFRGVRPVLQFDLLPSLVRSISAQQINLRWAAVIRARIAASYGTEHQVAGATVWSLDPERLAGASVSDLRGLQLTQRKSASLIACARAVAQGELSMGSLAVLDDEAAIERLVALPGIGRWSAEWFLARTLGRPRVVAGDLGVRKAVGIAYAQGRMPSEPEVRQLTGHWGSSAGVAQQLLLHALSEGELELLLGQPRLRPPSAAPRGRGRAAGDGGPRR
jgi:DNA-3-methyladenine glycosylase II